jgi:hypothetical protein
MTNENNLERQIIKVIATDRISMPISSINGKLNRQKPKLAKSIDLDDYGNEFVGSRVYARVETDDVTAKARTITQALNEFAEKYPRHGKILYGLIEEKRQDKESNLYFGMNCGCKLTADDYMTVMTGLGFTEKTSSALYPELMYISRRMSKKKQDQERSILIG